MEDQKHTKQYTCSLTCVCFNIYLRKRKLKASWP